MMNIEHPAIQQVEMTGYNLRDKRFTEEEISVEIQNENPVEDMFGSEIQTGDTWFEDKDGHVVLVDNFEDYLNEVIGVEFFKSIK